MKTHFIGLLLLCSLALHGADSAPPSGPTMHVPMMESTFKIQGTQQGDDQGTGFIVGKKDKNGANLFLVLVTADHVLSGIKGESATIVFRKLIDPDKNTWDRLEQTIKVRKGTSPLWIKHPDADLAAMLVTVPIGSIRYAPDLLVG